MKKIDKLAKKYNFKKCWLDDKSGYWYEKKMYHPILKKVKILFDEDVLFVECQDIDGSLFPSPSTAMATIFKSKLTDKNIVKILNWINYTEPFKEDNQLPKPKHKLPWPMSTKDGQCPEGQIGSF